MVADAAAQGAVGGAGVERVSVVDPLGTLAAGTYVDLVNVSAYRLTTTVDESMMDEVRPELERVVAGLTSQRNDTEVLDALAQTEIAGMPGFKTTLSFVSEGVPVTSTMYFLFSGDLEYQLTLQAATENWQAKLPTLEAIVNSFRVTAPK